MNDRCFIHGGKIVYILWSTFQVLWRGQRMEAEGLEGMKIDWIHHFSRSWMQNEEVILTVRWCLSLLSELTHPQQIMPWSVMEYRHHSTFFPYIHWGALGGTLTDRLTITKLGNLFLWNPRMKKQQQTKCKVEPTCTHTHNIHLFGPLLNFVCDTNKS